MSSSEEYLDSLLDSILNGGKSEEEEKPAAEVSQDDFAENKAADAGKAMSPDEIEEMLVSMGTLGGGDEDSQEQEAADQEDASAGPDDFAADDLSLDDFASEETGADDGALALDELSLDDLTTEEPEPDAGEADALADLSLDDLDTGESDSDFAIEELSLDDLTTEEPEPDAGEADALDDLSLDDLDTGESDSDFAIEELSLDDLTTEEPEPDAEAADALDDLSLDGLDTEESDSDFAIEELSLDDLTMEEPENAENDADGSLPEEAGVGEDDDLSALLAGMEHDEDLSEINDLLEESEQGVTADDDMLAMLEGSDEGGDNSFDLFESDEAAKEAEGIRELSPEEVAAREGGKPEKKEKKRRKLFGRKKKEKEEGTETSAEGAGDELEALLGEVSPEQAPQEEKKPGFFAKLLAFLLESDEEDEDPVAAEVLADNAGETGTVTDENKELLQELNEEDKKGKKKKKKKGKKGKKGKEGEEGEEAEGEEEEEGKKAKKKKKKKEKEKKDEEVDLFAPPEKKLSKKKVITVFLFCGTLAACIILLSSFLPNTMEKRDAHIAYDHGEYGDVYDLLYGKKRNEQDEILFQRSNLILQMNRKLSSYDNYVNLDMRLEALNALITGVERYQQILPQAETYNVVGEVNDIYTQILERLSAEFGVSEEEALDIIASEDDVTYSQRLEAIVNGELYGDEDEGGIRDMLPEEEEIIERIEGAE